MSDLDFLDSHGPLVGPREAGGPDTPDLAVWVEQRANDAVRWGHVNASVPLAVMRQIVSALRAASPGEPPAKGDNMTDTRFSESFDAMVWAKAFVQHVRVKPSIATDESTMLAWFANAIMRGYDEHAKQVRAGAEPPAREPWTLDEMAVYVREMADHLPRGPMQRNALEIAHALALRASSRPEPTDWSEAVGQHPQSKIARPAPGGDTVSELCKCGHSAAHHIEYERVYPMPCDVHGCRCKNWVSARFGSPKRSAPSPSRPAVAPPQHQE